MRFKRIWHLSATTLLCLLTGCDAMLRNVAPPDCGIVGYPVLGRVINARTREPILNAEVHIESIQTEWRCGPAGVPTATMLTEPMVLTTDADGRFDGLLVVSTEDSLSFTIRAENCESETYSPANPSLLTQEQTIYLWCE